MGGRGTEGMAPVGAQSTRRAQGGMGARKEWGTHGWQEHRKALGAPMGGTGTESTEHPWVLGHTKDRAAHRWQQHGVPMGSPTQCPCSRGSWVVLPHAGACPMARGVLMRGPPQLRAADGAGGAGAAQPGLAAGPARRQQRRHPLPLPLRHLQLPPGTPAPPPCPHPTHNTARCAPRSLHRPRSSSSPSAADGGTHGGTGVGEGRGSTRHGGAFTCFGELMGGTKWVWGDPHLLGVPLGGTQSAPVVPHPPAVSAGSPNGYGRTLTHFGVPMRGWGAPEGGPLPIRLPMAHRCAGRGSLHAPHPQPPLSAPGPPHLPLLRGAEQGGAAEPALQLRPCPRPRPRAGHQVHPDHRE